MAIHPASLIPPSEAETKDPLLDPELQALLSSARRPVQHARQVFTNRNLRMGHVEAIGFDMDYTLAIYHKRSIEQLSFELTLRMLVEERGYPPEIATLRYDHGFVMRGLAVDRACGNILKVDRFGHVGRAYHGRKPLPKEEERRLYRDEKVSLKSERFAWIDTLFALPEACLYAEIIELLEAMGKPVDYDRLYIDIRESIDTVHRNDSLKSEIRKDLAQFVYRDPELGPALHKLRSAGKRLFVATNSLWDYTDAVMSYLLDGCLAEYPSWRNYFDAVIVGASKPAFFSEQHPFIEVDPVSGALLGEAKSLERGRIYQGGNVLDFERMSGFAGERILYVGDHIYGDILRSKKNSLWRTCLVVEELEDEIAYTERCHDELVRLRNLEALRERIDDELNQYKLSLAALERRLEREALSESERAEAEQLRRNEKQELEKLRKAMKDVGAEIEQLEKKVEFGANPYWGLLFKEGTENSRFGEQVEKYACIYTSRVSNLLQYSPMQYFRSTRDFMPHERTPGAVPPLALAPYGSEGPPRGAEED